MSKCELAKGIYWVGAIDWSLRYFHGYTTQKGSSYNAYLIIDEKVALIDTVKAPFAKTLMENVRAIIDPSKIDYLVSLHVEMDHSGSIPYVLQQCPNAELVTSTPAGIKGLQAHFGELNALTVKTGDTLNLGKRSLQFLQTPMLHWPDNTLAYMPEEQILFSSDAFGQHYASSQRFNDQVPTEKLFFEAAKYYANIVLPYGSQTLKALDAASKLDIKIIAPAHGLIWRSQLADIIAKYADWGAQKVDDDKAVVVYDTMWHATETMADAITAGFVEKGIFVEQMSLQANHISDIMVAMLEAKYVAIGSPTINNNMLPTVAAFLAYMKGLAPQNRIGIAFGSYGWGGQSIGQIAEIMKSLNWQLPLDLIKINFTPKAEDLINIKENIKNIALKGHS